MDAFEETAFSPHAAQLHRGFPWLRFDAELEHEFREDHVRRQRVQTRIALLCGAALFLLFALRDVRVLPTEVWHWTVALRLYVIAPAIALMLAASYVAMPGRRFEAIGAAVVVVVMSATAASILISARMGSPLPYEALLAVMVLLIKFRIRRQRPVGEWGRIYRNTDPHSFPSGHAARAFLIATIAAGKSPE